MTIDHFLISMVEAVLTVIRDRASEEKRFSSTSQFLFDRDGRLSIPARGTPKLQRLPNSNVRIHSTPPTWAGGWWERVRTPPTLAYDFPLYVSTYKIGEITKRTTRNESTRQTLRFYSVLILITVIENWIKRVEQINPSNGPSV